ncbi:MAG TPA: methyltransferase domain-containing protein [Solirubrobacterales bacterium]
MRRLAALAGLAALAAALWWRKNPSACPYGQRFWVQAPHPLITRARLREVLAPVPGERTLEIGPGTGYYTADIAEWLGDDGRLDIFDIQQEMLDHAMSGVEARGRSNVHPTRGDATSLPFAGGSFDAVVLVTVLGEIPDQDAALREIARVLAPHGRLVVGELAGDPHMVTVGSLERRAGSAGLRLAARSGPRIGYFARLERA